MYQQPPPLQRFWEDTVLGTEYRKNTLQIKGVSLIVMSYNVLSQQALNHNRYLLENCAPLHLDWRYRTEQILREIMEVQPHIICIQEIEPAHYNFLNNHLQFFNSRIFFRCGNKSDGCAIFYDSRLMREIDVRNVALFREKVPTLDHPNVALLMKMQVCLRPNAQFVVANTHLLSDPKRNDARQAQVQLLLAEIDQFSRQMPASHLPVILMGDFNFTEQSRPFELISTGRLENPCSILPFNCGVTNECVFACNARRSVAKSRDVLSHNLSLESVFPRNNLGLYGTTYHHKWVVLDHMFYTKRLGDSCNNSDPKLDLLSRLRLPYAAECAKAGCIPNATNGTNHYSLAANFILT